LSALVRLGTLSRMSDRKLKILSQVLFAGGFLTAAVDLVRSASSDGKVGALKDGPKPKKGKELPEPTQGTLQRVFPLPKVKLPNGKPKLGKPVLKQYDVHDIDTRVGYIGELIRKGSLNPQLRETTIQLLAQKCDSSGRPSKTGDRWCVKEKDCLGEVNAIFNAVRNPKSPYAIRYTRDAMLADVFTAAERTLFKLNGGDCDDYVITLGAMLMAVGHPVRLRVVATRVAGTDDRNAPWSHIYLLTPTTFDNPNAKWVPMFISVDGSMDKPLGWEAPGAAEVAKSGKASGIIARVRDYTLLRPTDSGGE